MFILDFQQVMVSNIMAHLGKDRSKIDENLVRHMILNSVRNINSRFKDTYGKLIIAYDSKNSWRKGIFPYYKHHRKKARDASAIDWVHLFDFFDRIKEELKEVLPYKVIEVGQCEADDIIGTLARYARNQEPVLIVSGDKDFIQLHGQNVKQYDPIHKRFIQTSLSPDDYLFEHIIRGDKGDGIPNILSDDDTFVAAKRQTPITKKKLNMLMNTFQDVDKTTERNYVRNETLIDLTKTPEPLTIKVMEQYAHFPERDKSKFYTYLVKNGCSNLVMNLGDF
jgi:hypothetical protein